MRAGRIRCGACSRPDPGACSRWSCSALAFRSRIKVALPDLPALFAIGVLDVGADVLFAFATTLGLLSVVSILSSLYPVATVVLARIVLNERMARPQQAGIGAALAGVVLISI